jgi:hypothetical protein
VTDDIYTPLERALLCMPVPLLGLPSLLQPTPTELAQRELDLGYTSERWESTRELMWWLKLCGAHFNPQIFKMYMSFE